MREIKDFGPIYTETDLTQFPVEPFNTFSNLFFLAVVIYWFLQIKKVKDPQFKTFLKWGIPILFIGYIGGTVYHATRSHNMWLIMDFVPIFVLAIMLSFYIWRKVVGSTWKVIAIISTLVVIPRLVLQSFLGDSPYRITLGYVMIAIPAILPMFLYEKSKNWSGLVALLKTVGLLLIAVTFRAMDSSAFVQEYIPIGTHWLWHTFGGITSHLALVYLYRHTLEQELVA